MATLKQSTTYTRTFMMIQSSDHISGITGATVVVKLSKAGATGGAAAGTVTEVDSTNNPGLYKIALTMADTGTLGDLAFHCTTTSADPTDFVDQVTANILGDTLPANTTQLAGQAVTAAAGVTFPSSVASPTNITAGTITTTTNLTNAPTAGDFTSTMKTSIGTAVAASAVASVTGNIGGISGVTIPSTIASPTNITAGTITTVTNLTNAPTAGDFTATMKTSIGTAVAASAVASVTAAVKVDGTSALTESYAAQGAALTLAQALYQITQFLGQHSTATTVWTIKKRDGSTTAKTFTLNDATNPTAIVETT